MDLADVLRVVIIGIFVEAYFAVGWYFFGKEEKELYFSNSVRLRKPLGFSLALLQVFLATISWPAMFCLIFVGVMMLGFYDPDDSYDY